MKNVHRLTIRGRAWKVRFERPRNRKFRGLCNYRARVIQVSPRLRHEPLGTLLHEVLHACLPDVCEESVVATERAMVAAIGLLEGRKFL